MEGAEMRHPAYRGYGVNSNQNSVRRVTVRNGKGGMRQVVVRRIACRASHGQVRR